MPLEQQKLSKEFITFDVEKYDFEKSIWRPISDHKSSIIKKMEENLLKNVNFETK